jgi:D-glycero-alpha-D-manno-heptose-7-phosphate kinase
MSLFGGGTDYPQWYTEHGGAVLSTTINKYSYINLRWLPPFFDYKYRIRYFNQEQVNYADEILHPSVRECIKFLKINGGIEVVHNADLPARSGLGSSSAFTVGMLHSLYTLMNYMPSKKELAMNAINIEQNLIKESVGS